MKLGGMIITPDTVRSLIKEKEIVNILMGEDSPPNFPHPEAVRLSECEEMCLKGQKKLSHQKRTVNPNEDHYT